MSEDLPQIPPPAAVDGYEPMTAEFEVWIEHPDAFTDDSLRQLSKLEIMKLVKVLRAMVSQQETKIACITEISTVLGTARQLDDLLAVVMDQVTKLMEAERSTLFLLDEERQELWSKVTQGVKNTEIRLKLGQGVAGWVAQAGKSINIRDAYSDPRFNPEVDAKTGFQTRNILCQPIRNQEGKILGVIQVLNRQSGHFTAEDENLLSALSSQIAIAVENSTLYLSVVEKNVELVDLTRKLGRRVAELDLLAEIDREIAHLIDLESFAESIAKKMIEVFHGQAAVLTLREPEHLRAYFLTRDDDGQRFFEQTLGASEGISGKVIETRKPYLCNAGPGAMVPDALGEPLGSAVHSVIAVPLFDEDERVIGTIKIVNHEDPARGFTRDELKALGLIGSRVAGAIAARRHHEEMEKAARLASIGQMLSGVIHDLKNPIAIISGYVQLMARSDEAETRREYAATIKRQFEQLNQMTRELLNFARGETGLLRRKVFLGNFFEGEVRELLAEELGQRGIDLHLDVQDRGEAVFDEVKLKRAVLNLARNAADSMPDGGEFTVTVTAEDDVVVLEFRDTGRGVPEEIRDRLFDEFVTQGKESGTGLGLAIVKRIVDEHDGTIVFDSTLNVGTTFTIRLPRKPSQ